ncbi:MAG: AraC family transcriptional regulator [Bacteroidota bacterium]
MAQKKHRSLQNLKLTLLNIGFEQLDTQWDYDNVISPFSRLYLVNKGNAKVFHSYREFHLEAGHLYLIPSHTYSRYHCEDFLEQYYIHFYEEVGDGLSIYNLRHFIYETKAVSSDLDYMNRLLKLNPDRALKDKNPTIYDNRTTLSQFEHRNDSLSAPDFLETQALLQLLFSRFIRNAGSTRINAKFNFNDVLRHIGEHLHEDLSVADLAAFCHLSPDHFSRVFQQKFGLRPSRYLQAKRVERAETLLLTTRQSIKEIAQKTGWRTTSYFTRIFKKTSGITPAQFRRERSML